MQRAPHFNRQAFQFTKSLIWAYFLLIIFEGVLRKWVFPSLSSPLLFLRDPILLAIYVLALQNKWYLRNIGLIFLIALGFLTLFISIQFNPDRAAVALYGFRSNFLHLPLIFVIPRVFDKNDVLKVGRFLMICALPMAVLMAMQFLASPSAWINTGAGEGATQIASALGRIRPAGTFSFIVGPVFYFTLVTGFLIYTYFHFAATNKILIFATLSATMVAFVVSGSRSLAAACFLALFLALISMTAVRPSNLRRTLTFFLCLGAMSVLAAQFPLISQGYTVLTTRISEANRYEGGAAATLMTRVFGDFVRPIAIAERVPLVGEGLGMGTIGGSAIMTGNRGFYSNGESESEWSRHIIESGPLLGYAYIFFRAYLLLYLLRIAVKSGRRGNSLPLVLLGCISQALLLGQWGQSTIAAFTFFTAGMILAACREGEESATPLATHKPQPARVRGTHRARLRAVR